MYYVQQRQKQQIEAIFFVECRMENKEKERAIYIYEYILHITYKHTNIQSQRQHYYWCINTKSVPITNIFNPVILRPVQKRQNERDLSHILYRIFQWNFLNANLNKRLWYGVRCVWAFFFCPFLVCTASCYMQHLCLNEQHNNNRKNDHFQYHHWMTHIQKRINFHCSPNFDDFFYYHFVHFFFFFTLQLCLWWSIIL